MQSWEAVGYLCKQRGWAFQKVSLRAGLYRNSVRDGMVRKCDFRSATLASIAAVFGYKLCLVPDKDVPKSALIISPKESE